MHVNISCCFNVETSDAKKTNFFVLEFLRISATQIPKSRKFSDNHVIKSFMASSKTYTISVSIEESKLHKYTM